MVFKTFCLLRFSIFFFWISLAVYKHFGLLLNTPKWECNHFLVLHVDGILVIGNDIPTLQHVKTWFGSCFSMKDLGKTSYVLGLMICRDRLLRLLGLSHSIYIDKVLRCFSMHDSKKGFLAYITWRILVQGTMPYYII